MLSLPFSAVSAPIIGRQRLQRHLPAEALQQASIHSLKQEQRLSLAIGLPLQNQEELKNLLKDISDPNSPNYQHYLTPSQFTERFGPTENAGWRYWPKMQAIGDVLG